MAAFNVSDPYAATQRNPTSFPKYAKDAERYASKWKKQSKSPAGGFKVIGAQGLEAVWVRFRK